ncbi:carbamoyltransferase family protein [Galbibacter pacificus]|uniref:Carbamoyltransferase n=1 Tax=Galbibacter pacificus TaxID=2996052 RepID=A0ABT6FNB9_9FLAO|nr:carbamoyltransferase C-terminal domain-containing protein [Galbibacter pacificus]MDG3581284.1 carbamoyltransferase C-terminal domain-containing protein [Galbibacter pacificus]MDG3584762.1 hypothetical protein [Galbibacter pacificus]
MSLKQCHIGLSVSGHDPAIAIIDEKGEVAFAEATERFVQQKRAWGILPDHPEHIRSILPKYIDNNSEIFIAKTWLSSKRELPLNVSGGFMFEDNDIKWLLGLQSYSFNEAGNNIRHLYGDKVKKDECFDHHLTHAVNASYSAPFSNALCLVIDGEGEVGAASLYRLESRRLKRIWRSWGPGSLGSYYGLLTKLCGFDWRVGEEWKVMGLAAYGKFDISILDNLKKLVQVKNGKLFFPPSKEVLDLLVELRKSGREHNEDIMKASDLAFNGQLAYSYFLDQILKSIQLESDENLILTGGCALNSAYNGTIIKNHNFKNIHVPSAPADDGNAVGAALLSWMKYNQTNKIPSGDGSPYLGTDIRDNLTKKKRQAILKHHSFSRVESCIADSGYQVAQLLYQGKIIGIMRGRAEFGPRALGNRSILADPSRLNCKEYINSRVKGREDYRPFAPVVFEKDIKRFFDYNLPSPYMSYTLPWKEDFLKKIPGVVHHDNTGRLQTINKERNPWLSSVLNEFEALGKLPVLLNTSFNVMGKPIIHSVEDAMAVLTTTGLDGLLIDDLLIVK